MVTLNTRSFGAPGGQYLAAWVREPCQAPPTADRQGFGDWLSEQGEQCQVAQVSKGSFHGCLAAGQRWRSKAAPSLAVREERGGKEKTWRQRPQCPPGHTLPTGPTPARILSSKLLVGSVS